MMKLFYTFSLAIICFYSCQFSSEKANTDEKVITHKKVIPQSCYYQFLFEGSEPFWRLEIKNDSIHLIGEYDYSDKVNYAKSSSRGETFGFSSKNIYGIINKTWGKEVCEYAVTEEDSLSYEILFAFRGKTYRGCGKKGQ